MKNISDFNEETQLIIKQFIEDLCIVLPNLGSKISKEKIEGVILNNLEHNIEFNAELEKETSGLYNRLEKKIYISKRISHDPQKLKLTVFHELIHALTALIYTDELIKTNPYICEVLTTLLEERYNQMVVKKQLSHNRVNGYIPDFGRQLLLVYGDVLLEQFVSDPLNMHTIIYGFSEDNKKFLYKRIVLGLNLLNYQIKNLEDDLNVKNTVYQIERTISDQLFFKFNLRNASDNLKLFENLFLAQYYPDFSAFFSFAFAVRDEKKMEDYPVLKTLRLIGEIDDKSQLFELLNTKTTKNFPPKQLYNIVLQKIFGYIQNDVTEFLSDISDFLENEDVYSIVSSSIMDKTISVDEIGNLKFKRCNKPNSKITNKLTLNIFDEILGFNSSKVLFALFDSNDSMVAVYNEYELEHTKHGVGDVVNVIQKEEISAKIISHLNKITEQTGISEFYWENIVQDLEEDIEYWEFQIYYINSNNQLMQILVSFDKNKQLVFNSSIIHMEEPKELVAKAENIGIGTNSI